MMKLIKSKKFTVPGDDSIFYLRPVSQADYFRIEKESFEIIEGKEQKNQRICAELSAKMVHSCIVGWEKVLDENGKPLEWSPENAQTFMATMGSFPVIVEPEQREVELTDEVIYQFISDWNKYKDKTGNHPECTPESVRLFINESGLLKNNKPASKTTLNLWINSIVFDLSKFVGDVENLPNTSSSKEITGGTGSGVK